jgi:metallo-beta-lactamase family protein
MQLSFHGAVRGVTGSCHLLRAKDADGEERRLLFDCGLFQGERMCGTRNMEDFGFDPTAIDAVFITHAHADHTGRLPKLINEGYDGPIYMVAPTRPLTRIILEDAHKIMVENAKECGDPVLYEEKDVKDVVKQIESVGYHEQIEVAPDVTVMFHDAGHILGSSFISARAEGKKVVFSGDIGNDDVPILPPTEAISSADVVVCEATYGHRVHEPTDERTQKVREAIEHTLRTQGVLMIPSFSIERTQELLYEIDQLLLNELDTEVPIYLDSPMAIRATQVYRDFKQYLKFDAPIFEQPDRDFFSFKNLRETLSREESMTINNAPEPKIVIAGSGMMSGGRIMHHLIRYLSDPKNMLLIIGYQAKGTLGRQIYEGNKTVEIFGNEIPVKAKVQAIGSFSAHGDMHKLTRWLQPKDGPVPEKIFLTHGDPESKEVFATHLRHNLQTDVFVPEHHSEHKI